MHQFENSKIQWDNTDLVRGKGVVYLNKQSQLSSSFTCLKGRKHKIGLTIASIKGRR